jgi:hypothetical protein
MVTLHRSQRAWQVRDYAHRVSICGWPNDQSALSYKYQEYQDFPEWGTLADGNPMKDDPMNERLAKELEIQTENFKTLITDYCRLESFAALCSATHERRRADDKVQPTLR